MKLFLVLATLALLACSVQSASLGGAEDSLLPVAAKVGEVIGSVANGVEKVVKGVKDEAHSLLESVSSKLHLPNLNSKDAQLAAAALKAFAAVAVNALHYG